MRQAIVRGRNDVVVDNVELDHDQPRADEILMETEATFISAGTELAIYSGVDPKVSQKGSWCEYPFKPGYANVSRVLAVGERVKQIDVGDRIFTFTRHCSRQFLETPDQAMVAKVSEAIDSGLAAAARMAGVAMTSIQVATIDLNDWVIVFGLGTVGNLAAQFFQLRGARVIGVDPAKARRELAQRCGIARVVGGTDLEVAQAIRNIIGNDGVARITVDAVGHSAVIKQAIDLTARFGQHVSLGTPRAPVHMNATDILDVIHYNGITLLGALEWRLPLRPVRGVRHSSQTNVETIYDLITDGKLAVAPLISHRMDPEDIKTAYDGLLHKKEEYFGVVLDWKNSRGRRN